MTIGPIMPIPGAQEWSIGQIGDLASADTANASSAAGGGGFGGVLSNAIEALQQSQDQAAQAAQGVATGTVKDPQQAIVDVQNAQLAMQLAAQVRDKAVEAAQTIFQTQA